MFWGYEVGQASTDLGQESAGRPWPEPAAAGESPDLNEPTPTVAGSIGNYTHLVKGAHVNLEYSKDDSEGWGCLFVAGITQVLGRGRKSLVKGEGGGFGPAADLGLAVDIRDMPLHRPAAQHQFRRNLRIGLTLCNEAQHLDLAGS